MPTLDLTNLPPQLPLKAHAVDVPEFGEGMQAWVAELSADDRDGFEVAWAEYRKSKGQENSVGLRAFLVAACWCSPERKFIANGDLPKVAQQLGAMPSAPVTRLFDKASSINGIGEEAAKELEKN